MICCIEVSSIAAFKTELQNLPKCRLSKLIKQCIILLFAWINVRNLHFKCRHSLKKGGESRFYVLVWRHRGGDHMPIRVAHGLLGFHLTQPPPSHDLRTQTKGMFQVHEWSVRLAFVVHQLLFLCSLQASVCMVKPEDAQNLACSTELFIRQEKLTASVVKVPLKIHKNM